MALSSTFDESISVRVRIKKDLTDLKAQTYKEFVKMINKKIHVQIIAKPDGKFDIIKTIPFVDYLAGVVSKEMPLSWPLEALKTQAVVARSYTLYQMNFRKDRHFDLESNQMDQVFDFTDSEKAYKAVTETSGIVIHDDSGQVIKAYYHADCGGETLPASKVWPGSKDMGTAQDVWCKNRVKNRWSTFLSKEEFKSKIVDVNYSVLLKPEKLKDKVLSIANVSVQKLRSLFGYDLIRGSPSVVNFTQQGMYLYGSGYGHGVGLCQWGTLSQAKLGKTYLEILGHYYPKATINNSSKSSLDVAKASETHLQFN